MTKNKENTNYIESLKEYQDKQYLPEYYTGGKIRPALKAKTKSGGYLLLFGGIFLLDFYLYQLVNNFAFEDFGWIFPIGFSVLLIIEGVRFIKLNRHKK